jgi:hypothetical protein
MKLFFLLCLFFLHAAFAQDGSQLLHQKTSDFLQCESSLKNCNEQLTLLKGSYEKDTVRLNKEITSQNSQIIEAEFKIEGFRSDKLSIENSLLLNRIDSLNNLLILQNTSITNKNNEINQLKVQEKNNVALAITQGKTNVYRIIYDYYTSKDFNFLVLNSSLAMTRRDFETLRSESDVPEILHDLNLYFELKSLLEYKFSESKIENALLRFGYFKTHHTLIDDLKKYLEKYNEFDYELNQMISKLIKLDQEKSADNDEDIDAEKFKLVHVEVSDFIYNNYSYINYPYINGIIMEILNRKRENSDADISDLLD